MLIERSDLLGLLGPKADLSPGAVRTFSLAGSTRRAHACWDGDGGLSLAVTEDVGGDALLVVSVDGVYDADEDAFETRGLDGSGESSDPDDPRTAALAWRRLVAPMELVTR